MEDTQDAQNKNNINMLIAEIQKEAGNCFVNFLLAQAINMKSDIPVHFRDVLKLRKGITKHFLNG